MWPQKWARQGLLYHAVLRAFLPDTVLNCAASAQQYITSLFNSLSLHHEKQCLCVYIYSF